MRLEDLVIEVRNKDLSRAGQIMPDELDLNATVLFNNVGEWTLRLREEHYLVPTLRTPGAGLIVTGPGGKVLLSGPVVQPSFEATPEDRQGMVTVVGVTDDIILQDRLAWPDPYSPGVSNQTTGEHVLTGPAETLMHQYVDLNCGPGAPAVPRRAANLIMGTNSARGATLTMKARFPTLGELLNQISNNSVAAGYAPIGFRIAQINGSLVFETYETQVRTDVVSLSVQNNGLAGQRTVVSSPRLTHAIVGGKGELEDRNLIEVSNASSIEAQMEWGRRIEVFVDQRQEEGTDELTQAGTEALAGGGYTSTSIELIPSEDAAETFGVDWNLGDLVQAQVDGQTVAEAYVNGYAFTISAQEGFIFGATLSDTLAFYKAASLESRVSSLERNSEQGGDTGWITPTLTGGWEHFDGSGAPAQYRRKGGVVYLRGLLRGGSGGATAFQLPPGFRGAWLRGNSHWPVVNTDGYGFCRVWSDGQVAPAAPGTYVDIGSISFIAEQ